MTTPGYMPASQLQQLVGYTLPTMKAYKPTARMYERLHREGIRTRHTVGVATPGGAVRMYADLVDIQRQWLGKSHKRDWNLNPGSGAMPSLQSIHGLGRCLDFVGDVAWIKQVSEEYGLTYPLVYLGDTNHGQHDGTTRGQVALYPYEIKRLGRWLETSTGIANDAKTAGKITKGFKRGLAAQVAQDGRQGLPLVSHYSHYLDIEAKASAKAA